MNLQQQEQFYQVMTRLKTNSREASSSSDARITVMDNGILVSKPLATTIKKEPVVIDLQEYARAGNLASLPGININKLKAIQDFINSNGRV